MHMRSRDLTRLFLIRSLTSGIYAYFQAVYFQDSASFIPPFRSTGYQPSKYIYTVERSSSPRASRFVFVPNGGKVKVPDANKDLKYG